VSIPQRLEAQPRVGFGAARWMPRRDESFGAARIAQETNKRWSLETLYGRVLLQIKGIDDPHAKSREITDVPGYYDEMVNDRGGGDQRVCQQVILLPMHELGPSPEGAPIERQHVPRLRHLIDPGFDCGSFFRIPFAADSDSPWSSPKVTAER
jgi:hypothetical protein